MVGLVPVVLHLPDIILEEEAEVHRLLLKRAGLAAEGAGLTLQVYLQQFNPELLLAAAVVAAV
jgi:hypothetical protein